MNILGNLSVKLLVDILSTLNETLLLSSQWVISPPRQINAFYDQFFPSAFVTSVSYAIVEPLAYSLLPRIPAPVMLVIPGLGLLHQVISLFCEELLYQTITKEESNAGITYNSFQNQLKANPEVHTQSEISNLLSFRSRIYVLISALAPTASTALCNAWLLLFGQSLASPLLPEDLFPSSILPLMMLSAYTTIRVIDFQVADYTLRSRFFAKRGICELYSQICYLALLVGLKTSFRKAIGLPAFMELNFIDTTLPPEDFGSERYEWIQKFNDITPKWVSRALGPISFSLIAIGYCTLYRHQKRVARST